MSAIDSLVLNNQSYVERFPGPRPLHPKLKLAVVSCMDSRLDLFGALGLEVGDAHLMRNAGGLPTDDMLRSLAISQRRLGTREIAVIHHTNCGMDNFDDEAFRSELAIETDQRPPWNTPGFDDVYEQARRSLDIVRTCGWLPHRDHVRAFVFDVDRGALVEAV